MPQYPPLTCPLYNHLRSTVPHFPSLSRQLPPLASGMRSRLRDSLNEDVPRQEPRRHFGRASCSYTFLFRSYPSIVCLMRDRRRSKLDRAQSNTPLNWYPDRQVRSTDFPSSDRNSIPILRHLPHMGMMFRNPSGLSRNLRMLFRIPV